MRSRIPGEPLLERGQVCDGFRRHLRHQRRRRRFRGGFFGVLCELEDFGDVVVVHLGNNGTFTPEQFQAVATKYFQPNNRTVITGVKK